MWSNRKTKFTVVILVLVAASVGLWLADRLFGYTSKDHGAVFTLIIVADFFTFLGLAFIGFLTAWLLAFRLETLKRAIERSIAKRSSS